KAGIQWPQSLTVFQIRSFGGLYTRHSRESGNPVAAIVNGVPDSFIVKPLDSCFRRNDGLRPERRLFLLTPPG
ncbi:MAG: hypothetical protein OXL37_12390, partial [Chloroflexota bacterium]|nr:hypothetical protein [Chloroflexota bacterium]